ncbi:MAG: hypothetical protein DRN30_03600 [Thermoplasmata archaeon]|nr:MAG: hypothetical protein DRN30_03600 [Thermoplasmata archaeon]
MLIKRMMISKLIKLINWRTKKMADQKQIQEEMDEMEKALEEPEAGEEDVKSDDADANADDQKDDTSGDKDDKDDTDPDFDFNKDKDKDKGDEDKDDKKDDLDDKSKDGSSDDKDGDEDPRDVELKNLRMELDDLRKSIDKKPSEDDQKDDKSKDDPSEEDKLSEEDFLGDIDLDDLTRNPDIFNKVLNKVYMKGVEIGKGYSKKSVDSIISTLPEVMHSTRSLEEELQSINKQFYTDNEDLIPWKKSVAIVYDELAEQNPDKNYNEILPSVAEEVRKRLGIKKSEDNKDKDKDKDGDKDKNKDKLPPPPSRGKSGQRQTIKSVLSDFDKQSDEMDKALES